MNNRDNGFGDAFAREVLDVMNSKEHKAIFSKTAQVSMGPLDLGDNSDALAYAPFAGKEHEVDSPAEGAVSGVAMNERTLTPGLKGDTGSLGPLVDRNMPGVSDADMDMAELDGLGKRHDSFLGEGEEDPTLTQDELAMLTSYRKDKMQKAGGDVKNFKEDAKKEKDRNQAGMTEYEKELSEKTKKDRDLDKSEASPSMIDTLVVMADNLADKGFTVSEKLADRLMRSIIAEASVKTAGDDEKCDDKCCKKCKCEPCECKKNKKEGEDDE